jgi:hypothetical protein
MQRLRTNANGCPVPECRTGRYKFNNKDEGTHPVPRSRGDRCEVITVKSTPARRDYFCWLADCSWSVSDLCQLESGLNFVMALTRASVFLPRSFS